MTTTVRQRNPHLAYAVDLVLCVDKNTNLTADVSSVRERLSAVLRGKGRTISQLRVKVITFGGGRGALDALSVAMRSDWERDLDRRRHLIVLCTDTAPAGSVGGLRAEWELMDSAAARLLLFAPEAAPWTEISTNWNRTMLFSSQAGGGLKEWEMDEIITTVAHGLG